MKTTILLAGAVLLSFATGCGAAARSPDMYRDDTKAVLEKKNDDIRACYDAVLKATPDAGGKVTVKFAVETDTGKISNVSVDAANTTAPEPVTSCVTKTIDGLALTPADVNKGEGTWTYEFAAPGGHGSVTSTTTKS
jgi:hypothetical protein